MAAGFFSPPGTKYGPCKTACQHIDCADIRHQVGRVCRICQTPIGYQKLFYRDPYPDGIVHAVCLELEIANAEVDENATL